MGILYEYLRGDTHMMFICKPATFSEPAIAVSFNNRNELEKRINELVLEGAKFQDLRVFNVNLENNEQSIFDYFVSTNVFGDTTDAKAYSPAEYDGAGQGQTGHLHR